MIFGHAQDDASHEVSIDKLEGCTSSCGRGSRNCHDLWQGPDNSLPGSEALKSDQRLLLRFGSHKRSCGYGCWQGQSIPRDEAQTHKP